ncbi:MAG: rRNA maturation RNase YbeY [Coriobacteriales bacterium]|jgi:probable rRNA maturation factor|nr:rRNA maturation RNase YbeY [Coriobacteriales bacterium]
MDIQIDNRSGKRLPEDTYADIARFVLTSEKAPDRTELSISLVEPDEIHELNREYRNVDAPTDVLSFECDGEGDAAEWGTGSPGSKTDGKADAKSSTVREQDESYVLGDVIICPVVAREHARDFNSTFEHEMALMLTHGILHLLGYDHIDDAEAEVMEAREDELVDAWFANANANGSLQHAFKCALVGIRDAIKGGRNMKIELVIAALAIIASILLPLSAAEWACVLILIGVVLAAEVMNTAVEAVVDLISPKQDARARRAKDCAAGSVLILSIIAVLAGLFVFVSAALRSFGH